MPAHDDSALKARIVHRHPGVRMGKVQQMAVQPNGPSTREDDATMLLTTHRLRQRDERQARWRDEPIRGGRLEQGDDVLSARLRSPAERRRHWPHWAGSEGRRWTGRFLVGLPAHRVHGYAAAERTLQRPIPEGLWRIQNSHLIRA